MFKTLILLTFLVSCQAKEFVLEVAALAGEEVLPITSLTYTQDEIYGATNITSISLTPTLDGNYHEFSISPNLPSGVTLHGFTGVISGTPSVNLNNKSYRITVSNDLGSQTFNLRLTFLEGIIVDSTVAGTDDNTADTICYSTASLGCSVQAAIQTANSISGKQIILVPSGTHFVSAASTLSQDVVIQGSGMNETIIMPTSTHPAYRFAAITTNITVQLRKLSITEFGVIDGAVTYMTNGTLKVVEAKMFNNRGTNGGVFRLNNASSLNVKDSYFEGNGYGNWGGVMHTQNTATAQFDRSYFTDNRSNFGSVSHATGSSVVTYLNSTMYANISSSDGTLATPNGDYVLKNVTMVYNTNTGLGNAGIYFYDTTSNYEISNSIIAFNTQSNGVENNCYQRLGGTILTSLGYNIFSDNAGNCNSQLHAQDIHTTDPLLATLTPQDNGGLTPTFDLLVNSPAIDAGRNASCSDEDQRREDRTINSTCDIGALEVQ